MNKLINRKSYAIIALALLLILAWYMSIFSPGAAAIERGKANLQSLEMEIAQNRQLIASAGVLAQNVKELESDMNACLDGICSIDSISTFIQFMEQKFNENGITQSTVVPVLPDLLQDENISLGRGRLNRVEFDLSGIGHFLDIGRFIETLEKDVFYAGCNVLEISYKATTNPKVLFSMRFGVYLKGQV